MHFWKAIFYLQINHKHMSDSLLQYKNLTGLFWSDLYFSGTQHKNVHQSVVMASSVSQN